MKDGGWGRIVNFGSGSVFQGTAGPSHYAAAKAGRAGPYPITGVDGWRSALTASCPASRGPRRPLLRCGPGNVTAGPAGCGSVRRDMGARRCPERPHPVPGVTLSDAGGQGERTRTHRYGRQADLLLDFIHGDRTRRSARGLHSRLVCDTGDDRVFASGPAVTAPVDGDVVLRWPEWPAASLSMPSR